MIQNPISHRLDELINQIQSFPFLKYLQTVITILTLVSLSQVIMELDYFGNNIR